MSGKMLGLFWAFAIGLAGRLDAEPLPPGPVPEPESSFNEVDGLLIETSSWTIDLQRFVDEAIPNWKRIASEPRPGALAGGRVELEPAAVETKAAAARTHGEVRAVDARAEAWEEFQKQCRSDTIRIIGELGRQRPMTPNDWQWLGPLLGYYRCVSFAERNPARCDELKAFRFGFKRQKLDPPFKECRINYNNMVLGQAIISGDLRALEICEGLYRDKGFAHFRELCGILVNGRGHEQDCDKALPLINELPGSEEMVERAMAPESCHSLMAQIRADEPLCSRLEKGWCRAYVSYKQAYLAHDPGLCEPFESGPFQVCGILTGRDGAHCERYFDDIQGKFCNSWVGERMREHKGELDARARQLKKTQEDERKLRERRNKVAAERQAKVLEERNRSLKRAQEEAARLRTERKQGASRQNEIMLAIQRHLDRLKPALARLDALMEGFEPKSLSGYERRRLELSRQRKLLEQALSRFKRQTER